jgi:hypothetical protein
MFPGSVHIFPAAEYADRLWEYINRTQTHVQCMWKLAAHFLFWEYLFRIFGFDSLQFPLKNGIGQWHICRLGLQYG